MPRVLLAAGLVVALADWVAVARGRRRAEYLLKPLTLAIFIAAAIAFRGDPPAQQWIATVVALALSLAGDVFLMLPRDLFVPGLASFLLAHVAYITAFSIGSPPWLVAFPAAVAVGLVSATLLAPIAEGIREKGKDRLLMPVTAYVVVISLMVVAAISTLGRAAFPTSSAIAAATGALFFYASDGLIGWRRFVQEAPWMRTATMVLYHLGQALLVLSLAR